MLDVYKTAITKILVENTPMNPKVCAAITEVISTEIDKIEQGQGTNVASAAAAAVAGSFAPPPPTPTF